MAPTRLAMVACKTNAEGPWTRANGNEVGVSVVHLMKGERVVVEMEGEFGSIRTKTYSYQVPGSFPLNFGNCNRYRVRKDVGCVADPAPTTVEIMLNGTASR